MTLRCRSSVCERVGVMLGRDPRKTIVQDQTHHRNAILNFADREGALQTFKRCLEAPEGAVLPVLHYYGVGGAGKSLLLRKLVSDMDPALPWARVDFREPRYRDPVQAQTALMAELSERGVDFPRFALVRALLSWREGGEEPQLFQLNPYLNAGWEIVCATTPAGVAAHTVAAAWARLKSRLPGVEARLRQAGGTSLVNQLRHLDRDDLLPHLLGAFVDDLRSRLPARPGFAARAVLFLDTYEKLWEHREGPHTSVGRDIDLWVRQLYDCLLDSAGAGVLMVIAGRDALHWPQEAPGWRDLDEEELHRYLRSHELGGMPPRDVQLYLSRSGVGPPPGRAS